MKRKVSDIPGGPFDDSDMLLQSRWDESQRKGYGGRLRMPSFLATVDFAALLIAEYQPTTISAHELARGIFSAAAHYFHGYDIEQALADQSKGLRQFARSYPLAAKGIKTRDRGRQPEIADCCLLLQLMPVYQKLIGHNKQIGFRSFDGNAKVRKGLSGSGEESAGPFQRFCSRVSIFIDPGREKPPQTAAYRILKLVHDGKRAPSWRTPRKR